MNPDQIKLENVSKLFEYEKICRSIDNIDNIDDLKNLSKCYVKLYLKQQEVLSKL